MPGAGLVFLDLAEVEFGPATDRAGILGWNDFFSGHAFAGQHLDLQPAAELVLLGPDFGHGRAGVARDHGTYRVLIPKSFLKNSMPLIPLFCEKTGDRPEPLAHPTCKPIVLHSWESGTVPHSMESFLIPEDAKISCPLDEITIWPFGKMSKCVLRGRDGNFPAPKEDFQSLGPAGHSPRQPYRHGLTGAVPRHPHRPPIGSCLRPDRFFRRLPPQCLL
jgi:hypothetical protein